MAAVIFKGLICLAGFASLVMKMINPPLMSTMLTTIHGKINPVEFLRNPLRSRMEAIRVVMEAINTETRPRLDKGKSKCKYLHSMAFSPTSKTLFCLVDSLLRVLNSNVIKLFGECNITEETMINANEDTCFRNPNIN